MLLAVSSEPHDGGTLAVGWQWLRMVTVAQRKLAAGEGDKQFLEAKLKTARFYFARLMPQTATLLAVIQSGAGPVMAPSVEEF